MSDSSAGAEIDCSGCGQRLRVQIVKSGTRQRCPICKTLTPDPKEESRKKERRTFTRVSIALAILGLPPPAWPVGLYLIAFPLPIFGLELIKLKYEERGWDKSKNLPKSILFNIIKGLRDTASSVAVGLGIVCLAQLLLRICFSLVSENTVRNWEIWVVSLQGTLKSVMQLRWLLIALFVLFVVSLILPTQKPVSRYKDWRMWASRVLTALTAISSFTFFTSQAITNHEIEWVAKRRGEFKEAASRAKQARQNLVKYAYVKNQIENLPPEIKDELRQFFRAAAEASDGDRIIKQLGEDIGKGRPSFDDSDGLADGKPMPPPEGGASGSNGEPKNPGGDPPTQENIEAATTDETIERIEKWGEATDESTRKTQSPTLEDGRRVVKEAERIEAVLGEAEVAVGEALKTLLGDQLPSTIDSLVKPFVKSLLSSSVKPFLSKVFPRKVSKFREAVLWAQLNLNANMAGQSWKWDVGSVSHYQRDSEPAPPGPPPKIAPGESDRLLEQFIKRQPKLPSPPVSAHPGPNRSGGTLPCCKLCTYRNGILVGCVPLGCGPQCIGAR